MDKTVFLLLVLLSFTYTVSTSSFLRAFFLSFFLSEYLMKIPFLKILRVYSDQIEQKEFPIPNKLKPARITRSEDELKMSSEKIRSVSLHHLIRSDVCPCAEDLRTFEEGFAENKARGEPISEEDVKTYRKVG